MTFELLRAVEEDELGAWLRERRWFGSKAQELSHFKVLDVAELEEGLACALVEARFHAGTHDLYQLLVGESGGNVALDALEEPEAARVLLRLMEASEVRGEVAFHWTDAVEPMREMPDVRPMGAEQSNSSVVLDEALVLKVFRRLEPGANPELEMLRFLSLRGFPNIAALAGWYEFDGERLQATLGVAQRFIADGRDGWEVALQDPTGFLSHTEDLGRVTGRMHTVLGSDASDPDFAPEEPSSEALGLLTATIDEEIERVFVELRSDDERVAPIRGRGEQVRDRLQLLSHQSAGGRLIRHHGDYHLGQTLLASGDEWVILDFEGEPARSLVDRRRKRSPLRDVAGMLRSFAYVASARDIVLGAPAPEGWEQSARDAFLRGYFGAVDPALLPAGESATAKLLSIFELEKAVYELRYEQDNRPDWVGIPVAGIERLLESEL